MDRDTWDRVDAYFADRLIRPGELLDDALAANAAAGLPPIDVSPLQGKFLCLVAQAIGARSVLEIGTLGGFSTIWLARGVGDGGKVISLEFQPRYAEVARANVARAGLADRVDIRVGAALDLLPGIEAEGGEPFDLVFIDADKVNQHNYVDWALRLSRPGTVIIGDNVVRDGEILDPENPDPFVQGIQRSLDRFGSDPRLSATAIQTVGSKGWDGFSFAVVE